MVHTCALYTYITMSGYTPHKQVNTVRADNRSLDKLLQQKQSEIDTLNTRLESYMVCTCVWEYMCVGVYGGTYTCSSSAAAVAALCSHVVLYSPYKICLALACFATLHSPCTNITATPNPPTPHTKHPPNHRTRWCLSQHQKQNSKPRHTKHTSPRATPPPQPCATNRKPNPYRPTSNGCKRKQPASRNSNSSSKVHCIGRCWSRSHRCSSCSCRWPSRSRRVRQHRLRRTSTSGLMRYVGSGIV